MIAKLNEKHLLTRYLIFTIAMLIGAINFNLLIKPSKIVAGGVNGLAILFEDFFNIPPSLFIFLFSGTILLSSLFILGITKASSILLFTIIYPFFVRITSVITNEISIGKEDLLLFSIFIGIITGIVNGICYRIGLGAGPIPLISQVIHKFTRLPLSKITFMMNAMIIIVSGYKYGIEKVIYALIIIYVNSLVIDKILLRQSSHKILYIVTDKYKQIETYLTNEMKSEYQILPIEDMVFRHKTQVIITFVKNQKYAKLKEILNKIDNDSCLITLDSYEIYKINYPKIHLLNNDKRKT